MKEFLRDSECSKADILRKVKESLLGKTKEELQKMIQPGEIEKLPVIIAFLILAFLNDPKYNGMDIHTFFDKALGEKKEAKPDAPK
jgi:hypothetical protein